MMFSKGIGARLPGPRSDMTVICWDPMRAQRLRELATGAYRAARTPTEAKMASILLMLFAPNRERAIHGYEDQRGSDDDTSQSLSWPSPNDPAFAGQGGDFGGGGAAGSW